MSQAQKTPTPTPSAKAISRPFPVFGLHPLFKDELFVKRPSFTRAVLYFFIISWIKINKLIVISNYIPMRN
jgi:hypothetical protein